MQGKEQAAIIAVITRRASGRKLQETSAKEKNSDRTKNVEILVEKLPDGKLRPWIELPQNGEINYTAMADYLEEKMIPIDSAHVVKGSQNIIINDREVAVIYEMHNETRSIPKKSKYSWCRWKKIAKKTKKKPGKVVEGALEIMNKVKDDMHPK
jgi:hypothetical protein